MLKEIEEHCRANKLLGFEIPKSIFLINDTFMNLGLTTATSKL